MDNRNQRRLQPMDERPNPSARKRTKPQKSQFMVFYILTLFIGVVICIAVFALVFNSVSNQKSVTRRDPVEETSAPTLPPVVEVKEVMNLTGVIQEIDNDKREVLIYDIDTGKEYTLAVAGTTKLKNRYGTSMVFGELSRGDIVEADFDKESGKLDSLSGSSQAWELKNTSSIKIDQEALTLTVGNNQYSYNKQLIVTYKGKSWSLNDIQPIDVITVKGAGDKAWFIEVNKSHGYLTLFNKERIKDGTLEIDTTSFMTLDSTEKIEVLEGVHVAVVKGSNVEPYSKDILVSQGETVSLDLMEVQVKTGILNIKVNQTGYTVLADGKTVPSDEPLVLEYGEYTIQIEKEDYLPWSQKVVINQPVRDLAAEIEKEIKLGNISVTTIPEGAEVYIDNGLAGLSPISVPIAYGPHTLLIVKEGYINSGMSIEVKGNDQPYLFTLLRKDEGIPGPTESVLVTTPEPSP